MTQSQTRLKALEALEKIQYGAEWDWDSKDCNIIRDALQENMGATTPPSMEAELVEALERIRKNTCCDTCREAAIVAGDALIKYRSRK